MTVADEFVFEPPVEGDVERLGEMFLQDMKKLGVETDREVQHALAEAIVEQLSSDHPEVVCWVAREVESDLLLGVVMANFNWSPKFGGRSLWIETLYVDPRARRRGIGRKLVGTLLDWASHHEVPGIDIEAYRGNTPASVLYRTMGFRRLGRERFGMDLHGE